MAEFTIGDMNFRSRKMDVFVQANVLRALGPMLSRMGPLITERSGSLSDVLERLGPMFEKLAEMEEAKFNDIMYKCLAVVSIQQTQGMWAPIFNPAARKMQFENLEMPVLLQITMNVLGDNFGNFFPGSDQTSPAPQDPLQNDQSNTSIFRMG